MKRVIFVDDEPHILEGLERMLRGQRKHWDMTFAPSGEAALEKLQATPFDVMVTDMRMPGIDGATLLTKVQELHPNLVRIVLSGHTELEAAMRTVPVAHQFLTKPCDADTLREVVERACDLHVLLADEALRRTVGGMDALPSLPRLHNALTRALLDPDVALRDVAGIVEQDIGMCAKVLQLVNSAFFGLSRRVMNIGTAVGLLGINMLKNLVLSIEVFSSFEAAGPLGAFSLEALQSHALLASSIAKRLLPDRRQAEDAFMATMLHDVGQLILATRLPKEFGRVLATARTEGRPLQEVEREQAGVTHAEVGAYLLGLWGLPYPIIEAVAHHHEPTRVQHDRFGLLGAVYVANLLAHEHGSRDGRSEAMIDTAYLERLGVADQLGAWREAAAEIAGSSAAA